MRFTFVSFLKILFLSLLLTSCGALKIDKTADFEVRFLDEYIIPEDLMIEGTKVGGLSDLDYDGQYYYTICDLPSSPRIYQMDIILKDYKIDTILFKRVINIHHKEDKDLVWDSEGLVYDKDRNLFIVSTEGSVNLKKDPFIAEVDSLGNVLRLYNLPDYLLSENEEGPRQNGVFEGLTSSVDDQGIWAATELPLKADGATVKLYKTHSPIRFTYFDKKDLNAHHQFAYPLGRLRKVPFLPFGMGGISTIMAYKEYKFLVLERAFSAGHSRRGIRARLYETDASKASNTLEIPSLRKKNSKEVAFAEKKLIFDFNTIRKQLTDRIIDNLEGISFGPVLPNGNPSLLIISDNNFSSWTQQMNQVILLELIPKNKL